MDVHVATDFNQAIELSQYVCAAANVPNIYANLATSAFRWEQRASSNGVSSFGPGRNAFRHGG